MSASYRGMIRTEDANIRESITVGLTSCFVCLNSAALLKLNEQQFNPKYIEIK